MFFKQIIELYMVILEQYFRGPHRWQHIELYHFKNGNVGRAFLKQL